MSDLIWSSLLDERFKVEVRRVDGYTGMMRIYDQDEQIFSETVGLSYGAQFGPDVGDVAEWEEKVVNFVDNIYKKG